MQSGAFCRQYVPGVSLAPAYLLCTRVHASRRIAAPRKLLGLFIYVSLFASILSYIFWNKGIDILGAAKTGHSAYLLLGETLQFYNIAGAVLIGAGIYTSLFSPPSGAAEKSEGKRKSVKNDRGRII